VIGLDAPTGEFQTHSFDNTGNAGQYKMSGQNGAWRITGDTERAWIQFDDTQKQMTVKWEQLSEEKTWLHWIDLKLSKD
jgi:hypothetical protein